MFVRVEVAFPLLKSVQVNHHDVGELVGHAFGGVAVRHLVDAHAVVGDRCNAGLLAQFTQCGLVDVLALVHQSSGQPIGEGVVANTVFAFNQVSVRRRVVYEHHHTGGMA